MMELMNQQALEIGEHRRREVALDTMRAARASRGTIRHATGTAVMVLGRRIYGELPGAERSERQREAGAHPSARPAI